MQTVKRDERALLKALIGNTPCGFQVTENLPENVSARYDAKANTVYVRPCISGEEYIRGVSQELAKAVMARDNAKLREPQFAAYCVSYMVSKRFGVAVEGYSFEQLPDSYRDMTAQDLRGELNKVRDISGDMISDMRRYFDAQEKSQKQKDVDAR